VQDVRIVKEISVLCTIGLKTCWYPCGILIDMSNSKWIVKARELIGG
jgi:hypothetical protein